MQTSPTQHTELEVKSQDISPKTQGTCNDVVAVLRGHKRMLSANFGRSQGIRYMISASSSKN